MSNTIEVTIQIEPSDPELVDARGPFNEDTGTVVYVVYQSDCGRHIYCVDVVAIHQRWQGALDHGFHLPVVGDSNLHLEVTQIDSRGGKAFLYLLTIVVDRFFHLPLPDLVTVDASAHPDGVDDGGFG